MCRVFGATVLIWADVFAYYVLWMTMTYLTNVWKISLTSAAAIINFWSGASRMLPVPVAHLADAFVGNFTVLLTSTLSYCVGLGLLAMSTPPVLAKHTGTCSDYKPECVGDEQKLLFYIGLGLIAIGSAGHLTSLKTFTADQLIEEEGENGEVAQGCNMPMYFFLGMFAMVLVPIAGVIVIPYVKPWSVRYGIAAIFALVALLIFLCGTCSYNYVGPQGSPITTIVRVFVAASSKLFSTRPPVNQLYEKPRVNGDAGEDHELLPHTNGFCCLDKAAIILPNIPQEEQERNKWKLCTVTDVEGTKISLQMIPMWLTFIVCGIVSSVGNTYFLEQANHMNHKVGRLTVPIPVLLWIYDHAKTLSLMLYVKLAKSLGTRNGDEIKPSRYAPPIGIAISMGFAVLCCITAAKVEARRLHVVEIHGLFDKPDERIPMTMFWLLPQFVLLGMLDGMYAISIGSFFVDQVGPTHRKYLEYFSDAVFGSGVMGSVVSVYIVGRLSKRGGMTNWFQSTINKSRLDNYYWVLAALSAINLVVYTFVAWFFRFKEARAGEVQLAEPHVVNEAEFEDNARCCC